jgi:hypothetical protein
MKNLSMLNLEKPMDRSVTIERRRTRPGSVRRGLRRVFVCGLLAVSLGACSQLLDVEVPGAVKGSDLENPALMRSVTVAALGEVECALGMYIFGTGILNGEFISSAFWRSFNVWGARLFDINRATGSCSEGLDVDNIGFYVAIARARFMTDDAFKRIEAFTPEELGSGFDKPRTLSTLASYAGFTYVMLGEGMCNAAIDAGPMLTPAATLALAETKFTTALTLATTANDAGLQNLARVGRARVRLNLGKKAEAAADAKLVPTGFTHNATYSTVAPRRHNRVNINAQRNSYLSVPAAYRNLMVGTVADPRVALTNAGRPGHDNLTPLWLQTKYPANTSPIPMATWREAQLIIAEAELGQSAVDRINVLRDFHKLPRYAPANVADDAAILTQIIEERRRELFIEGHRINDMLRFKIPFPSGTNHKGEPYGPITCHPLPEGETGTNPNI